MIKTIVLLCFAAIPVFSMLGCAETSESVNSPVELQDWESLTVQDAGDSPIVTHKQLDIFPKALSTPSYNVNFGLSPTTGLGVAGMIGYYDIEIRLKTYKRCSDWVFDGSLDQGTFCSIIDQPWNQCQFTTDFNGSWFNSEASTPVTGVQPDWLPRPGGIEGPYNKMDGDHQWEWPNGSTDCTERDGTKWLLQARYDYLYWDGQPHISDIRVQWYEDDDPLWDDHSWFYFFPLGEVIQFSLQQYGDTNNQWTDVIPEWTQTSFLLRAEDDPNFRVRVWYTVEVKTELVYQDPPPIPVISLTSSGCNPMITWAPSPSATEYKVYKGTSGTQGPFYLMATLGESSTSWVDDGWALYACEQELLKEFHYYKIKACNAFNCSDYSNSVVAHIGALLL